MGSKINFLLLISQSPFMSLSQRQKKRSKKRADMACVHTRKEKSWRTSSTYTEWNRKKFPRPSLRVDGKSFFACEFIRLIANCSLCERRTRPWSMKMTRNVTVGGGSLGRGKPHSLDARKVITSGLEDCNWSIPPRTHTWRWSLPLFIPFFPPTFGFFFWCQCFGFSWMEFVRHSWKAKRGKKMFQGTRECVKNLLLSWLSERRNLMRAVKRDASDVWMNRSGRVALSCSSNINNHSGMIFRRSSRHSYTTTLS